MGSYSDITCLSNELDVGFIVLKNETYGGTSDPRGWVYSLAALRSDYSHWILLYCRSAIHFQLAALTHEAKVDQAVFTIQEIPQGLRHVYDVNNPDACIGQGSSSGVS